MPGDEVPTAATLSPAPIARSALLAWGLTLTAAPISPKAGAASNSSAFTPRVVSACAAATPASPPPTIAILQLADMRLSSHSPGPIGRMPIETQPPHLEQHRLRLSH